MKILTVCLFCLVFGVVSAAAQTDHCFENDGLKVKQKISMIFINNKVEGVFETGSYDDATSAETSNFTGTKTGNLLTIKFDGKPPYELAPGTKKIVWTLGKSDLKVPTYGKNYDTRKYSTYNASFEKCKANN